MTATKIFDKKGVYHSALAKAGPVLMRFKGEPHESKGGGSYVYFEVQGEEGDHYYNIENDAIGDLIARLPVNQWMRVVAEGTREGATLNVSEAEGHPIYTPDPAPEPTPQNGPPPMWPDDPGVSAPPQSPQRPVAGALGGDAVARAVEGTLRAVSGLEKGGVRVDSDAAARIFNTLFINESRR